MTIPVFCAFYTLAICVYIRISLRGGQSATTVCDTLLFHSTLYTSLLLSFPTILAFPQRLLYLILDVASVPPQLT